MSEIQNIFCSFQVVQRIFNKLLLDFYVEFKNNKIYAIMFYLKKLSFNYFLIFRIINKICQKPVRETVARFIGSAKVDISFCIGFHYHVTYYCTSRYTSSRWNRKTFSKLAFQAFHRFTTMKIAFYGERTFFLLEMIPGNGIVYKTIFPLLRYRQSAPPFLFPVFNRFYLRLKSSKRYG